MSSIPSRPNSTSSFYSRSNAPSSPMSSPKPRASRGLHDFVSRRSAHVRPFHTRGDRSRTESPSPSDGYSEISVEVKQEIMETAGIFEASSLGDSESTISRRQQLEQHKLPVPLVGAAARRDDNDDELVVLDQKPQIFEEEEQFSDEDVFDETAEVPGGYDVSSDNDYGYTGEHDGYEESEKSEDDEDATQLAVPPEPGLWDNTQQTLSSRGLFDRSTVGNEMSAQQQQHHPQQQDRQQQQQRTRALPLRGNRFPPPQPKESSTFRPLATARSTSFVAASSTVFGDVNPTAASSSAFANPPILHPPPLPKQQRSIQPSHHQQHQQHQHPLPSTQQHQHSLPPPQQQQQQQLALPPPHHDPDQTVRLSRPTSPTAITPLLADSDLRSIPSYPALLSRLQELYLSSRSAAPANLSTELSTLLSYSYPSKDVAKVSKFITSLPDDAYEAAGDIILARKRELEERLREMQRKRRKVVEARTEEVREVAEERVRRLEMLRRKREELRGGVGKLLRENGWAVEL